MILGMSLATFTQFHVIISLIAIASGFVVVAGMLAAKRVPGMTALFLLTSVATSVTGFMFPTPFDAADVIGIISLICLALSMIALYRFKLTGAWRRVYVVGALAALYFNCFVLVVQSFQKIAFLHAFAPTQKEPPFAVAQAVVLILFVALGFAALKKFRPSIAAPAIA